MYGKIFTSIYDGSLVADWRALITFQQFIILSTQDGMVDMTPDAISRRTGIPIEHIKTGIEILEKEDKYSRTPDQKGRRIELIDSHRPWGWHIINHEKYKQIHDLNTVREQTKERVRRHRERKKEKEECNGSNGTVTVCSEKKRHIDIDIPVPVTTKSKHKDQNRELKKIKSELTLPEWLDKDAWSEFEQHRKETKKPLTDLARKKNLLVLEKHKDRQSEIINNTIANRWQGLFEPKENKNIKLNNEKKLSLGERATKERKQYENEQRHNLKII